MKKTPGAQDLHTAEVRAGARLDCEIELPDFTDAIITAATNKMGGLHK